MLEHNYILIHLVIVILSIILSYIIYRYLKYDLIDISKFVKNDIEKFTSPHLINEDMFINDETAYPINEDMFINDETAYPILEDNTKIIQDKLDEYLNKDTIDEELERLQVYNRK